MSRPGRPGATPVEKTIQLKEGWHCLHMYYSVDQQALNALHQQDRLWGIGEVIDLFSPDRPDAPIRMQLSNVSGHRADMGLLLMDPDPLVIDNVCQSFRSTPLGTVLKPTYSFVSITEVSEYVPTIEQYGDKLRLDGTDPDDPAYQAKLKAYEQRLPTMNRQRLYPEFPNYPVTCFYPMNKIRHPHANWYQAPFSERSRMMAEHATSGIQFAGKVSQVITASTGFDDWEWGVNLWGAAPEFIKDIVYTMRFDEASARYAEFGPFYIGYVMDIKDLLKHLRIDH